MTQRTVKAASTRAAPSFVIELLSSCWGQASPSDAPRPVISPGSKLPATSQHCLEDPAVGAALPARASREGALGHRHPALPSAVSAPSAFSGSVCSCVCGLTQPSRAGCGPELVSKPRVASTFSNGWKTVRRIIFCDVKITRNSHGHVGERNDTAPACRASAGHLADTARVSPRRPVPKSAPLGAGQTCTVGWAGIGNPRIISESSASFRDLSGSFKIFQYWQKDFQRSRTI